MQLDEILKDFLRTDTFEKILFSILIVFILWILNQIINKVLDKKITDIRSRYNWGKSTSHVFSALGFILVGIIWFVGIQSLATFLGLLSAGLAIALKDLVSNFVGWIFILWRKPFEVGNRIQIGNQSGDVIDIRPFQFSILEIGNWVNADQSTGRMIHIPNGFIFNQPLFNYDRGFNFIWNEIKILVTFESNWQDAKKILNKIVDKHALKSSEQVERQIKEAAKNFMIKYKILTPIIYTSIENSGILLTIRYLCEVRKRRSTSELISEDILIEFAKRNDIDFAYPTTRFYDNRTEGKTYENN